MRTNTALVLVGLVVCAVIIGRAWCAHLVDAPDVEPPVLRRGIAGDPLWQYGV